MNTNLAHPVPADDHQLAALVAEWDDILQRVTASSGLSDDERDAIVTGELADLEDRINATPATTFRGAALKARMLAWMNDQERAVNGDNDRTKITASLCADIERLAEPAAT